MGAVSQEAPTEPEVQTQGVLSPQVSFSRDAEGGGVGRLGAGLELSSKQILRGDLEADGRGRGALQLELGGRMRHSAGTVLEMTGGRREECRPRLALSSQSKTTKTECHLPACGGSS